MLVTDIIQRAVAGRLRFDFIESVITVLHGNILSSQKGRARCDPADGCFLYHFRPHGGFADEWILEGGYLDHEAHADGAIEFQLSGVERNSTAWSARAERPRLTRGAEGAVVHAAVKAWSRTDERSVHSAFVRVVVPGRIPYPTTLRHAPGHNMRHAIVSIDTVRIEFRDYGGYTEISADTLPESFAQHVVDALADVLEQPLGWVFKEQHRNRRRTITVQQVDSAAQITGAIPAMGYEDFWRRYSRALNVLQ